jgi:hypothetical protein
MAEYSADLYAKNPQEKASYVVYYRYNKNILQKIFLVL